MSSFHFKIQIPILSEIPKNKQTLRKNLEFVKLNHNFETGTISLNVLIYLRTTNKKRFNKTLKKLSFSILYVGGQK